MEVTPIPREFVYEYADVYRPPSNRRTTSQQTSARIRTLLTCASSMLSSSPVALDEWTTHAAQINGPAQPGSLMLSLCTSPTLCTPRQAWSCESPSTSYDDINKIIGEAMIESMFRF